MTLTDTGQTPERSKGSDSQADRTQHVLVALRRIIRATDLHSKRLLKQSGMTTPQLVVLQSVEELGEVTTGEVSRRVSLSQATVTHILDRLEGRGLIERYRSRADRRVVHARLTRAGRTVLRDTPSPLHQEFVGAFSGLSVARQKQIIEALDEVARMMGAENLDAAPLLDVSPPAPEQD